ncbi:hypothetical protein CYLTODRAFT_130774 [Cylindrobasidium torrendii FP15055 ss-10]|uniref:Uncharacterized protein n=1 Tax=Cylindrobasidium torrendii FP15055 ss-10 TaxID=1314674 RepID=A0A0D7AZH4_9AGAR|nr:hypothetical protein CYLTODRAFT_130774 [Cylindrobasidium torrendii FP15055 ss-10]
MLGEDADKELFESVESFKQENMHVTKWFYALLTVKTDLQGSATHEISDTRLIEFIEKNMNGLLKNAVRQDPTTKEMFKKFREGKLSGSKDLRLLREALRSLQTDITKTYENEGKPNPFLPLGDSITSSDTRLAAPVVNSNSHTTLATTTTSHGRQPFPNHYGSLSTAAPLDYQQSMHGRSGFPAPMNTSSFAQPMNYASFTPTNVPYFPRPNHSVAVITPNIGAPNANGGSFRINIPYDEFFAIHYLMPFGCDNCMEPCQNHVKRDRVCNPPNPLPNAAGFRTRDGMYYEDFVKKFPMGMDTAIDNRPPRRPPVLDGAKIEKSVRYAISKAGPAAIPLALRNHAPEVYANASFPSPPEMTAVFFNYPAGQNMPQSLPNSSNSSSFLTGANTIPAGRNTNSYRNAPQNFGNFDHLNTASIVGTNPGHTVNVLVSHANTHDADGLHNAFNVRPGRMEQAGWKNAGRSSSFPRGDSYPVASFKLTLDSASQYRPHSAMDSVDMPRMRQYDEDDDDVVSDNSWERGFVQATKHRRQESAQSPVSRPRINMDSPKYVRKPAELAGAGTTMSAPAVPKYSNVASALSSNAALSAPARDRTSTSVNALKFLLKSPLVPDVDDKQDDEYEYVEPDSDDDDDDLDASEMEEEGVALQDERTMNELPSA